MLTYYFTSLGLIPYFTSRAFIPLFATAAIGRFGPGFAPLADVLGVRLLASIPAWATSDGALLVLGLLALAEAGAAKVPEVREMLTLTDSQLKAVAALLVCFAMVRGNPADLVDHIQQVGLTTDFAAGGAAGHSLAYIWSFVIGSIVWLGAAARNAIYSFLIDLDPDDDLGVQGMLSWLEDGIGFFGVLFAVIFPILALVLVALTLTGLWGVKRLIEKREQRAKVPCPDCATPNAPCGPRCPSCQRLRQQVAAVGILGIVKSTPAPALPLHRLDLLARKRCAFCGDRLTDRRLDQGCSSCQTAAFESSEAVERYLQHLRASLPKTLAVLTCLSFIPLFGLVPGVVYYRLSLISSLRGYVPRSTGFLARWAVRLLNIALIALQPIPLLGTLTLPLMCLTNFQVYQALLRRQASGTWQRAPALAR